MSVDASKPDIPTHAVDLTLDAAISTANADRETGPHSGPTKKETHDTRTPYPVYPEPATLLSFLSTPLGAWAFSASQQGHMIWNPCCGAGGLARVLRGVDIKVYATDRRDYKARNIQDHNLDFLDPRAAAPGGCFGLIGFAHDGQPYARYVARSLEHLRDRKVQVVAWLLPHDFDSATRRFPIFTTPRFTGKVVLTFRPEWINRKKKHPKNNWCWYVWSNANLDQPAKIYYAERTVDAWLEGDTEAKPQPQPTPQHVTVDEPAPQPMPDPQPMPEPDPEPVSIVDQALQAEQERQTATRAPVPEQPGQPQSSDAPAKPATLEEIMAAAKRAEEDPHAQQRSADVTPTALNRPDSAA